MDVDIAIMLTIIFFVAEAAAIAAAAYVAKWLKVKSALGYFGAGVICLTFMVIAGTIVLVPVLVTL